jgi:predicted RNase H-related nuclease YkuK (DUF458 family)
MEFKLPNSNGKTVDLVQHIYEQKSIHQKDLTIHVGCDSTAKEGIWWYALVVSFRYGKSGAHYIYQKIKIPAIRVEKEGRHKPDIFTKLWKEAEISIQCAEYLKENHIYVDAIEMDYNTIPKWASNKLIGPTEGWARSLGYRVLNKADEQIAVKAADHICDHI